MPAHASGVSCSSGGLSAVPGLAQGKPCLMSPSVPPAAGVEAVGGHPPLPTAPDQGTDMSSPLYHWFCIPIFAVVMGKTGSPVCLHSSPDHPGKSSLAITWFLRAKNTCSPWPLQSRGEGETRLQMFLPWLFGVKT